MNAALKKKAQNAQIKKVERERKAKERIAEKKKQKARKAVKTRYSANQRRITSLKLTIQNYIVLIKTRQSIVDKLEEEQRKLMEALKTEVNIDNPLGFL